MHFKKQFLPCHENEENFISLDATETKLSIDAIKQSSNHANTNTEAKNVFVGYVPDYKPKHLGFESWNY